MLTTLIQTFKSSRTQPSTSHPTDQNITATNKDSQIIHLQRAVELYRPIATEQPSRGLLKNLKIALQRVRIIRDTRADHTETLAKMEHIFGQLHRDFDERERQLDKKLAAIEAMQAKETRLLKWSSIPLATALVIGLAFIFYIAYSMQHSVAGMSVNMGDMSKNISSMTTDTQNMSSNMSHMTGSMHNMNSNMAYMSHDVSSMNQNMGAMSRSVAPMGQAAESAAPMMGMMRSFMPF
jgi:hypothetical protein